MQTDVNLERLCLISYFILPASNALLQDVVRWKKYKQPIGYNSSKIDWKIKFNKQLPQIVTFNSRVDTFYIDEVKLRAYCFITK